ncbi:uncharacterized protein N7484_002804 [Penicillium longicatenatum]|uniref:uncharacterized protein n=1 Tax=Penicillium longicatenatum TaxID=1561947 RepID=UPI0025483407|nr:uncharacterized protein N7484_002804 [Penicillium longicatenatum]KAJ5649081.1 hypothetical protein N7484_002804 [Penicillium longicatenatum]
MTATSSLLPSGMEIPAGEDLEMASPYQGQADDFDIDIDLMEDHVSNMDSDMMGADDFPNTSQPSLFQNDLTDDADMVDEASEGSMVDADNLAEEDHDIEVQYDDVTYETDMLEGDQDETADVAVPAINIEATPSIVTPAIETNDPTHVGPEAATGGQEAQFLPPVANPVESEQQQQESIIQAQEIVQETIPAENVENEQIQPLESAEHITDNDNDKEKVGEQTNEPVESMIPGSQDHHTPDHSAENLEDPKASSPKTEPVTAEQAETYVPNEIEHENTHEDESLHTVKVIYQDNEISLFPPLEGDSAETFFLHDEDVAYDNVGRLFSSLREVLLDNIAEHDTLVIDIDSLGIQITEDSSYTSKITLHQILDIYLRLCHNDGIHDPDALYLSLSSKAAIHHELASLDSAAKEGKGLSQIHLWADYDEEDPVVGEAAGSHEQPGPELPQEPQDDQPNTDDGAAASHEAAVPGHEATDEHDEPSGVEDLADEAHQEPHHSDADVKTNPGSHSTEAQDKQETHQGEDGHHDNSYGIESYNEEHDYAEDPRTESTGTVAPEDASVEATHDDWENHELSEHHDTNKDNQALDNQNLDDDEDNEFSGADDLEVADLGVPVQNSETEDHHEDGAQGVDSASQHSEEATNEFEATGQYGHESEDALEDNTDPNAYEESESTLENLPQEDSFPEQPQEPENYLLGIAEDVMQTPAKNNQHDQADASNGANEEYFEDDFTASSFEDGGDGQQNSENDYNYDPELDAPEEPELGEMDPSSTDSHAPDNLSVKRSRDEDDEWDITETTTPEIKRRRPS